jgi:SH3-like domain-containing protein
MKSVDKPTVLPDATSLPTMTVSMSNAQVRVNGTGAAGLFLRKDPSRTAEVLKTLPDGTTLQIVGANKTVDDVVWRNVRDSDGNEGWVSAGYVVPIE